MEQDGRIFISAETEEVREVLGRVCERLSVIPESVGWRELQGMCLEPRDIILLETGDDAAAFVRAVYEVYWRVARAFIPRIVGFVTEETMNRNETMGWWDIDGHAALDALMPTDNIGELEHCLTGFLERLRRRSH